MFQIGAFDLKIQLAPLTGRANRAPDDASGGSRSSSQRSGAASSDRDEKQAGYSERVRSEWNVRAGYRRPTAIGQSFYRSAPTVRAAQITRAFRDRAAAAGVRFDVPLAVRL